ncbi:hypothetical protein L2E82_33425 [Cichorium intybus]|uniref:Uncharacterized protein n=1 Tax=Cichorium intybus TaxID=13427 RepID=A0ACB9BK41_CICIN|nr:hypothetical protein L2E82_33425 [Cichorium intybus]
MTVSEAEYRDTTLYPLLYSERKCEKSRGVHVPQPHDIQLKEWQPRVPSRLVFREFKLGTFLAVNNGEVSWKVDQDCVFWEEVIKIQSLQRCYFRNKSIHHW